MSSLVRKFVLAMLALAIIASSIGTVSALQDLKITSDNLAYLESWSAIGAPWYSYGCCITPQLLKYDWGVSLNTYGGSKTAVYLGLMKAIKVRDGECVKFVNALANRNGKTADDWDRGTQVMSVINTIAPGTLVAKFNADGSYDTFGGTGRVAIFARRHWAWTGSQWQVDGFDVWDQNFVSPYLVGQHTLKQAGAGVYNANNYYVVHGP